MPEATESLNRLAIEAIAKVAGIEVSIASHKETMLEHRKELGRYKDKFESACDKLTKVSLQLETVMENKKHDAERVDKLEELISTLATNVSQLTSSMQSHIDTHCDKCPNEQRISEIEEHAADIISIPDLEKRIEALEDIPDAIKKFRKDIQKPWPALLTNVLYHPKIGPALIGSVCVNLVLQVGTIWLLVAIIKNREAIQWLWELLHG